MSDELRVYVAISTLVGAGLGAAFVLTFSGEPLVVRLAFAAVVTTLCWFVAYMTAKLGS
ncbi:hypothetical protein [Nocardia wallacei]|uniref:hypothetical protein n=1 Tax=Nocardia wallacei TaxID=480035 RepID=UPI002457B11A|nr:hypothetical protein [Nocardia wallacei]